MKSFESSFRGYNTGRMHEDQTLGKFVGGEGYRKALEALADKSSGHVPRPRIMDLIREHSMSDPGDPKEAFPRELRQLVVDELDLNHEDAERLRFYSAVGTPADTFHGMDGWIEYQTPEGKRIVVTIDVTMNQDKADDASAYNAKADVLIAGDVPDAVEDADEFIEFVERYAKDIARRIKNELTPKRVVKGNPRRFTSPSAQTPAN